MKTMKTMILLAPLFIFAPALSASAQSTTYSDPAFTATFNGPVTVYGPYQNTKEALPGIEDGGSEYTLYTSGLQPTESVFVRKLSRDIPVDAKSADEYVKDATALGANCEFVSFGQKHVIPDCASGSELSRKNGLYQGHPYSEHIMEFKGKDGTILADRLTRWMVVDSRTVIVVDDIASGYANVGWEAFSNSLVTK